MNDRQASDRVVVALVTILTVLAAALRLHHLDSGLWFDEITTLVDSVRPRFLQIVTHFPGNNDHPLYSVLAHGSVTVFGEHPWSLRLPAMLFGVASIPMLYLFGSAVTTRCEALLATSILTVSYHHIWFSQNARGYTALFFWVLLATFLLLRVLSTSGRGPVVAYGIVAALGSYTHLTMVFIVLGHALVCASALFIWRNSTSDVRDWRRPAAAFLLGGTLTVLFYAPLLQDVQIFFTDVGNATRVATPFWAILEGIRGLRIGFGSSWVIGLGGVIFCAGLRSYFRQRPLVFYLFVIPVALTLLLAIAMGRPIFPRFLFFSIGFGLLVTIRGATAIGTWMAERAPGAIALHRPGVAVAVLFTVGAIAVSVRSLPYGYRFPKQDYTAAVDFVAQNSNRGDRVAVIGPTVARPVLEYLGQPWERVDRVDQLRALRARGAGVWLIYTFPAYIETSTPDLWKMIQTDCTETRRFRGTVAGGDIDVYRCS